MSLVEHLLLDPLKKLDFTRVLAKVSLESLNDLVLLPQLLNEEKNRMMMMIPKKGEETLKVDQKLDLIGSRQGR